MVVWCFRGQSGLCHSMDMNTMEEISKRLSFTIFLCIVADEHKPSQALWRLEALCGE